MTGEGEIMLSIKFDGKMNNEVTTKVVNKIVEEGKKAFAENEEAIKEFFNCDSLDEIFRSIDKMFITPAPTETILIQDTFKLLYKLAVSAVFKPTPYDYVKSVVEKIEAPEEVNMGDNEFYLVCQLTWIGLKLSLHIQTTIDGQTFYVGTTLSTKDTFESLIDSLVKKDHPFVSRIFPDKTFEVAIAKSKEVILNFLTDCGFTEIIVE
jgi:hypothetical protein